MSQRLLFHLRQEIIENADFGAVMASDAVIRLLRLERSFDRHTHKRLIGHPLGRLLRLHLNNYCAERTSKNGLRAWYAAQPALQEDLDLPAATLTHQDAYRPLDYLPAPAQAAILNDAVAVLVTEFGLDLRVLYEDTSSSYFEGEQCPLGAHGYSRDHRPDRPQVNYDVGVLPGGFPGRAGVYAGRVPDNRVIDQVSDEWMAQHPDLRTVLVLDRGMTLLRNRQRVIGNGQGYVAGLKIDGATRTLVLAIPGTEFTEAVPLPETKEPLQVVRRAGTIRVRGQKVSVMDHIFYNPAQAARDRAERARRIVAARQAVAAVQAQVDAGQLQQPGVIRQRVKQQLKQHQVHVFFRVQFDTQQRRIRLERRKDKLAERAVLDGKFVLQTTEVAWPSAQVLTTYRHHDEAEKVIQCLKQVVPVRPIRHWNDQRVAAHIFLSILACLVLAVLRHLARQVGWTAGIGTVRAGLRQVRRVVSRVALGSLILSQVTLTGLTAETQRLLTRLGVPLPASLAAGGVPVCLEVGTDGTVALVPV